MNIKKETLDMLIGLIKQGDADKAYNTMINVLKDIGFSNLMARKIAWRQMQSAEAIIFAQ